MKEKIKNFFIFIKNAWIGGPRGKIGFMLMIISLFFFVRLFYGEKNLQSFVMNAWRLNQEKKELNIAEKKLKKIQRHNELLQNLTNSSDYIEELGLKNLNFGDADFKELKY